MGEVSSTTREGEEDKNAQVQKSSRCALGQRVCRYSNKPTIARIRKFLLQREREEWHTGTGQHHIPPFPSLCFRLDREKHSSPSHAFSSMGSSQLSRASMLSPCPPVCLSFSLPFPIPIPVHAMPRHAMRCPLPSPTFPLASACFRRMGPWANPSGASPGGQESLALASWAGRALLVCSLWSWESREPMKRSRGYFCR